MAPAPKINSADSLPDFPLIENYGTSDFFADIFPEIGNILSDDVLENDQFEDIESGNGELFSIITFINAPDTATKIELIESSIAETPVENQESDSATENKYVIPSTSGKNLKPSYLEDHCYIKYESDINSYEKIEDRKKKPLSMKQEIQNVFKYRTNRRGHRSRTSKSRKSEEIRKQHNKMERQRRKVITDRFEQLLRLIPGTPDKLPKRQLLDKACQLIKDLEQKNKKNDLLEAKERKRNKELVKILRKLKNRQK